MTYVKKLKVWSAPDDDLRFRRPTKHEMTAKLANFYDSFKSDHQLFAITVVFKPIDANNDQARWESEYRTAVLNKFRRAIVKNKKYQSTALPYPDIYYFEWNEASIHRISGSRKPPHIHALLPIRNHQVKRVWDEVTMTPKPRLLKDVQSIATVQNMLMEPIIEGHTIDWVRYITKSKMI